jgi:hypothetical protein
MRLRQGGRFHLFPKKFAQSANFLGKRNKSTTLPQAKYTVIGSKRPVCTPTA